MRLQARVAEICGLNVHNEDESQQQSDTSSLLLRYLVL